MTRSPIPHLASADPTTSGFQAQWEHLRVEIFQHPAGEQRCAPSEDPTICLSLSPRPVRLLFICGDQTHTGLFAQGDISITPAHVPLFARWDSDDHFLQIGLTAQLIQQVAADVLQMDSDRWEFLPEFRLRDPQLEAIGMMLLHELQQANPGSNLYIDSLANVLAVHLLRHYAIRKPSQPIYSGGLPQRQLMLVLDYLHDHLQHDIKLGDLAALLDMSEFHFSRQFKRAIGKTPYQYLLGQRIEHAKQLLQHSDRSITDIALLCGFNSHSHLSQQFRKLTGLTPKAYRLRA